MHHCRLSRLGRAPRHRAGQCPIHLERPPSGAEPLQSRAEPIDAGPIQTKAEYGPGGGFGLRFGAGAEARIWRGLYAGVNGFVEHFALNFNQPPQLIKPTPPCPCGVTGGATDDYYGVGATVGYRY